MLDVQEKVTPVISRLTLQAILFLYFLFYVIYLTDFD